MGFRRGRLFRVPTTSAERRQEPAFARGTPPASPGRRRKRLVDRWLRGRSVGVRRYPGWWRCRRRGSSRVIHGRGTLLLLAPRGTIWRGRRGGYYSRQYTLMSSRDRNRGMRAAYPERRRHTDAGGRRTGRERRPIPVDCRAGSRCSASAGWT